MAVKVIRFIGLTRVKYDSMRTHSIRLLLAVLTASALLNIWLTIRIAQLSRQPTKSAVLGDPRPPLGDSSQADKDMAELERKVRQLELEKTILAQEPEIYKENKVSALRKNLRTVHAYLKKQNGSSPSNPDVVLAINRTATDIAHLFSTRLADVDNYAQCLKAFYETVLEMDGVSLSGSQSIELSRIVDEMAAALKTVPLVPAGERQIKEVEIDLLTLSKIESLMAEDQLTAIRTAPLFQSMTAGSFHPTGLLRKDAGLYIALAWKDMYRLSDAQFTSAVTAAQQFLDSIQRYEASSGMSARIVQEMHGTPLFKYRIQFMQSQMEALRTLESSMTTEQTDRLRKDGIKEFFISD